MRLFFLTIGLLVSISGTCQSLVKESVSEPEQTSDEIELITTEEPEKEVVDEVFTIVEQQPHFPGGMGAFYSYIMKNMRYPKLARRMGVEGKVFVQFVIDTVGNVTEIKAIKGIGADCDSEAIRIIKESPKWQPGVQRGKPVPVRMVLPITFRLGGSSTYSSKNNRLRLNQQPNNLTKPDFPGGFEKYLQFIQKNKKDLHSQIPINKWDDNTYFSFRIDTLGKIGDIKVEKSLGESFDNEIYRLINSMPNWVPATVGDSIIDYRVKSNVSFRILSKNQILKADKFYIKAIKNYESNQHQKAINNLDKAIEIHPTKLNYYFDKAVMLLKMQKTNEACETFSLIKDRDEEALAIFNEYCK